MEGWIWNIVCTFRKILATPLGMVQRWWSIHLKIIAIFNYSLLGVKGLTSVVVELFIKTGKLLRVE